MSNVYDVFLSFKNLNEGGQQTPDSRLAEHLYIFLSGRGFKVFFSNASLEQMGAADYSKAIDDALDHSKVLVVVGTSEEHLNSRWVRYEWDSFSNEILSGRNPEGKVFVYVDGVRADALPRKLRQTQCIEHGPEGYIRLYNFIINSLESHGVPVLLPENTEIIPPKQGVVQGLRADTREKDRLWFKVAIFGRIDGLQHHMRADLKEGHSASETSICADWTDFCAIMGANLALRGYSIYGSTAESVGEAFYYGACEALAHDDKIAGTCHLMPKLPINARQRQMVRKSFFKGVHVGVAVGGSMGTMEEYEILRNGGAFCIPIGVSGGTAYKLWARLIEEYQPQLSVPLQHCIEAFGNASHTYEQHLDAVLQLIDDRFNRIATSLRTIP